MKKNEERPKLTIVKEPVDWLFELIGLAAVVFLIAFPIAHFAALPDAIPVHYGIDGKPDAFGNSNMIWLLSVVGIVIYISLVVLSRYPHIFNYPKPITAENAYVQYKMACRLIRILNAFSTSFFAYLSYAIVHSASGKQNGLGTWFVLVFVVLISAILGIYIYKAMKH